MASSKGGTISIWECENWQKLIEIKSKNGITCMCFFPDGKKIAFGNGLVLVICNAETGSQMKEFKGNNVRKLETRT